MRHINDNGLSILKKCEGLKLDAYRCPAGVWTIGYGHTKDVKPGDKVTPEEAELMLLEDLEWAEKAVATMVTESINDNEFSALVSFVFNVGSRAFKGSTLLKLLNKGDHLGAARNFEKWVYADGQKLRGLEIRRRLELALFLTP